MSQLLTKPDAKTTQSHTPEKLLKKKKNVYIPQENQDWSSLHLITLADLILWFGHAVVSRTQQSSLPGRSRGFIPGGR